MPGLARLEQQGVTVRIVFQEMHCAVTGPSLERLGLMLRLVVRILDLHHDRLPVPRGSCRPRNERALEWGADLQAPELGSVCDHSWERGQPLRTLAER